MTKYEIEAVQTVIQVLERLIPESEMYKNADIARSPVFRFAETCLTAAPSADMSCVELWAFFSEVVAAKMLPSLQKTAFFRELPAVMKLIYGIRKSHNITREGKTVRGFRGVEIRDSNWTIE